jgi:D-serine deaminase-like pyridoxal phosphate-dependent protein
MQSIEIPTPALVIDEPALERNIARMAAYFADGPCRLRPHFKAHKTPEIARRQLGAGSAVGLTCATITEAEVAASVCDDLLIANEIVSPEKCARIAILARGRRVRVAVDSTTGLTRLAEAAVRTGVSIGVLVDVNVGQNRCGVLPGRAALELAERVHATPGVVLDGVMGYEGHVQAVSGRKERESAAGTAMLSLVATAELIRGNGLPCDIVSAGGTGTFDISSRVDGVTEIQAGSYALMDSDYGKLDLPFEQALFVLATVISRPTAERIILDCGHKACAKDHGLPTIVGMTATVVVGLNDEHATVTVPATAALSVGDRVRVCPSHIDPTMNLHDEVFAVNGDEVVGVWPITARGYTGRRQDDHNR